jgi:hypothetical protein
LPDNLLEDIRVVGGEKLFQKMLYLKEGIQADIFREVLPIDSGQYRKLARVDDKEMKTRVIAILDYFSQSSLKPFHHYLFKVLMKIPQDRTFSQGDFNYLINNSEYFYSVDLTAATDRFPMDFICHILKGHLPNHYISS